MNHEAEIQMWANGRWPCAVCGDTDPKDARVENRTDPYAREYRCDACGTWQRPPACPELEDALDNLEEVP